MKLVKGTDNLQKKKPEISDESAEQAIKTIIQWIGEDDTREDRKSGSSQVLSQVIFGAPSMCSKGISS